MTRARIVWLTLATLAWPFGQNAPRLGAQDLAWARAMGGTGDDEALDVAVDASGNVYTVGHFGDLSNGGTVDFDPSPGTLDLVSAGSTDIFVSKLDSAGNLVWARRMGGTGRDGAFAVDLDDRGNIHTVGIFSDVVDLDPGPGTFNLNAVEDFDLFVSKLDTDGNFLWAHGIDADVGDVAVDRSGNVFVVGHFFGTTDFDPGLGIVNLSSAGSSDVFVSKFDGAGNFLWARRMGGPGEDVASQMALDNGGNIHTVGVFGPFLMMGGTADFDTGSGEFNLTSAGELDVFVSKLDSAGNFVWAHAMGGPDLDISHGVGLDEVGSVYVGGYSGTFDRAFGGDFDISVSKLDSTGNLVWARTMGGVGPNRGLGVAVDGNGDVYTVGNFRAGVDFDPGPGSSTLVSEGDEDIFVCKLDSGGRFVWARAMGGAGADRAWEVELDARGNLLTVGSFQDTVDFNPSPEAFPLSSVGKRDAFVHKMNVGATQRIAVGPGVNAASFVGAPVVGGLASFFGSFPGVSFLAPSEIPLPRRLGPVQVEFFPATGAAALAKNGTHGQAGGVLAPLLFVSNGQINLHIPWEVDRAMGPTTVVVSIDGVSSEPVVVPFSPATPGVFTFDFGPGRAVAINNADGSIAQPVGSLDSLGIAAKPVTAGDVLLILATGLGPVTPSPETGEDSLDERGEFTIRETIFRPSVFLAGVEVPVLFSGLSPQFVGVYQVNVLVPGGLEPGNAVSLIVEVNGVRSREDVTIAVSL